MSIKNSKVTPPSDLSLKTYFNFTYASLTFTWIITPLMLFVIFKQSKQLKSFKWFILNHSFWCIAYESWRAILKPVILAPACSGYSIGLLSNSSMVVTNIATVIGVSISTNCAIGLGATIACRYALVFPSKLSNWLSMKVIAIESGILSSISIIVLVVYGLFTVEIDKTTTYKNALDYDPFLKTYFNQKSFVFIPYVYCSQLTKILFVILTIILITSIAIIFYFVHLVKHFNSKLKDSALKQSLIVSSIVQLSITCIFLIFPVFVVITCLAFEIRYTATVFTFLAVPLSMHCILEFTATLYFVKPYRKFLNDVLVKACRNVKMYLHLK